MQYLKFKKEILRRAEELPTPRTQIPSRIDELDRQLVGGLPHPALIEFGAQPGRRGREIILRFINFSCQDHWVLWACCHDTWTILPSAWLARGTQLERIKFAYTQSPLKDLKPAFTTPFFHTIVLDSPKRFTSEELSFLQHCSRKNSCSIYLIKDHFISNKFGNIWAKKRIQLHSCIHDPHKIEATILKGAKRNKTTVFWKRPCP